MSNQKSLTVVNGWLWLPFVIIINGIVLTKSYHKIVELGSAEEWLWIATWAVVAIVTLILTTTPLTVINPNKGIISSFAGKYKGQFNKNGFFAINPFYSTTQYDLAHQTMTTTLLKINDSDGNPIVIQAVIVYHVQDMYKAQFEVINYEDYMEQQSDAALRRVTSKFSYKNKEFDAKFEKDLLAALSVEASVAGCKVVSVHTTELSYAPEIAGTMLQRQQAEATIEAKEAIVKGALDIVNRTVSELKDTLTPEAQSALVVNLLTVLAGDKTPVVTISAQTGVKAE